MSHVACVSTTLLVSQLTSLPSPWGDGAMAAIVILLHDVSALAPFDVVAHYQLSLQRPCFEFTLVCF